MAAMAGMTEKEGKDHTSIQKKMEKEEKYPRLVCRKRRRFNLMIEMTFDV